MNHTFKKTLYLMGTRITLYFKGEESELNVEEASQMLLRFEKIFSANDENSPIARLKKTAFIEPQRVNSDLFKLIKIGREHSLSEDSSLNIAIGPLVKLWRIGFKEAHVPEHEKIIQILDLLKVDYIILDEKNESVFFLKEGIEIDLGAIAKGYFCDKIMAFFKKRGAISAMVDIGGNVLVYGESPTDESEWNVGIQNPFLPRGNLVASVKIKNQSVVTSGIYERVYKKGNNTYHHIFDRKTGYPIENNLASLTIIADTSLECDLYTTKLFGLDIAKILREVNSIEGMSAIIITKDGRLAHTDNLKNKITYNTITD